MPMVDEYFSSIGTVNFVEGRSLTQRQLIDTDILLVRSVTQVNKALLENTTVKFVGTATIGTDHVDLQYLKQNNIGFASAPGCNANSVAEFILSALIAGDYLQELFHKNKKLAIVGVGNVGTRVAQFAEILGFEYICYDPPRENSEAAQNTLKTPNRWCNWQQVLDADVISLHVPFNRSGPYATKHMFSKEEFISLRKNCLLINSSRGGVVDNSALLEHLSNNRTSPWLKVILDVWENEPAINLPLRDLCIQHTPHIAGYSIDGKHKGTEMMYQAVIRHFALQLQPHNPMLKGVEITTINWSDGLGFLQNLKHCILSAYDINQDSMALKRLDSSNIIKSFDLLRQNYPDRLEFKHYLIEAVPRQYKSLMKALGFQVASPILEPSDDR